MIKQMTTEEYKRTSSKGFRGQTIIFTNARARCHTIADALGIRAAAYHAGLSSVERRDVETKFLTGKLMAVVTTAALGAGVDFPASQVIFDALAMGRDWLSVQEFNQMGGRAGRPDFHDLGRVVILAEPGGSYSRENPGTEEEIAIKLLKGEMEEVAPVHEFEASSEEYVANAICLQWRRGGPQPDQQHDGGEHGAGAAGAHHAQVSREARHEARDDAARPRDGGAFHRHGAAAGDHPADEVQHRAARYHRGAGVRGCAQGQAAGEEAGAGGGKPGERLREPEKREHQQSPRGKYQANQSAEKPKHVQSAATKMHVGHELPPKHQKVRRKR